MIIKSMLFKCLQISFVFIFMVFQTACSEKNRTEENIQTEDLVTENVISKIESLSNEKILVCAHRGFHQNVPENSIASIKEAIKYQIDIVEIDITSTKDGVLILMHDNTLDRTTNATGNVSDYTFEELLDFNLKMGDSITKHKIPTLSEALSVAKDKVILNLDIKNVDTPSIYNQLKKKKMHDKVFSFFWDTAKIEEMQAIDSTYAILPLVSSRNQMLYYASHLKSPLQHFEESSFTEENMNWAKENGILVFMNSLWEIDEAFVNHDTQGLDEIINLRPAIIQTDYPVELINYLKTKELHE